MILACRICCAAFDTDGDLPAGDALCCRDCRAILNGIAERGKRESYGVRHPEADERIARYREKAEKRLPLFE